MASTKKKSNLKVDNLKTTVREDISVIEESLSKLEQINDEFTRKLSISYNAYKTGGGPIEKNDKFYIDFNIRVVSPENYGLKFEYVTFVFFSFEKFAKLLNPTETRFVIVIEKHFDKVTKSEPVKVTAELEAIKAIYPENINDIIEDIGMIQVKAYPVLPKFEVLKNVKVDILPDA